MEQQCEKKLPYLLVPDRHAIKDWLYENLEKQNNQTSSSGEKKTKQNKKEGKHRIAVEISQKYHQYLKTQNQQSKYLWEANYPGILLDYPGVGNEYFDTLIIKEVL